MTQMKEVAKDATLGTVAGIVFFAVVTLLMIFFPLSYVKRILGIRPKSIPQERGRYQILSASPIVRIDTATGRAWVLGTYGDRSDVHKWVGISEDTTEVWAYVRGKLQPVGRTVSPSDSAVPSDPLHIR